MIGTGIYLKPSEMAREAGSAEMVLIAWVAGGLLCLLGALTYAELATAIPETGGDYVYLRRGLGPLWAFLYGWRGILVSAPASLAAYGTGIALFVGFLWPGVQQPIAHWNLPVANLPVTLRWSQVIGVLPIVALTVVNYLRIRDVGRIQVVLTTLKTLALIAIIVLGLGFILGGGSASVPAESLPVETVRRSGFSGFMVAVTGSLWAYSGWHQLVRLGGEVRDPGRAFPIAMIGGFLFTGALFLIVNLCYIGVLSFPGLAASSHPASDMIQAAAGPRVANLLTIVMIVSVLGTMNASLLTGSRVPFAMARDGLFFPSIAKVDPERRVPTASVTLISVMGIILVLTGSFEEVTALMVFASWSFYGLSAVALFRLRAKEPDLPRPYRTIGYPVVPALFLILSAFLTVSIVMERPLRSLIGIGLILAGVPFYLYWNRRRPRG
jgi:APA family basic amino acid/polyamine antiporter